ncbi:alpha-N-acetylglucosaminidase isoform X1 [Aegilops tauschii subsp. strangulata]|uniref:alpha-N-acetylglucosaminidase isoform X1 n=1 Tax=Aegilops tauschii subsp. strangulata TaxID=200361 RepID=UPI001ABC0EBD|nr:alpha-N-acetylglucosaminidase isoform X1 [Aegilops tauschii subsp. strangulata]
MRPPPSPPLLPLLLLLVLLPSPPAVAAAAGPTSLEALRAAAGRRGASPATQERAAAGVLRRLLPSHALSFRFQIDPKGGVCGDSSCFRISNVDGSSKGGAEILIQGNTAVELASGLHWYLKYWCGVHISWDKTGGAQLASVPSPGSLPRVKGTAVKVERPVPWNYYQNVVTSSYSFVWWDWRRWEKEIDWMALQGINLPLAFTGQEAVWQKVFKSFNVTDRDLDDFFGGPAFLAWARMGNLHAWGGPLSQNWLDQQLALQKKILSRMIELGMVPVLPSFSGNVPVAFKKLFPSASITRLGEWNTVDGNPRWCCTYILDPSDALFIDVGQAFIKQQMKEYGDITSIYNCDTFNENTPPTNEPAYISSLGSAIYQAMSRGNKDAVWLMQGWLFYSDAAFWKESQMKALLHSVPIGKMMVLDLFADVKPIWQTSSQFYGVPYIWCMLHNFGGNIEMYGVLDSISSGPIDARTSYNSTMVHFTFIPYVGVGMCMEGIEHNPVVYELMSEMAFRSQKVEVEDWLKSYSYRRYGQSNVEIQKAWAILYHTIYNCTDGIADHNRDYIVEFPDISPSSFSSQYSKRRSISVVRKHPRFLGEVSASLPQPHLWYSTAEAVKSLELFLKAGDDLSESLTYRYDLVDLARQSLSKLANKVYLDAMDSYQMRDSSDLNFHTKKFLEVIMDIETLLASDDNFLLGPWLETAKSLATTEDERKQYEWNARTQVTMWYDDTKTEQSKLHDYANKFWSGLLKSYYHPRASKYFTRLSRSLQENRSFQLEEWRRDWISYSNEWQSGKELYPVKATGDALAISRSLFAKYFR